MSQVVISSTDDSSAWDDDNSVTINIIYSYWSDNTWYYVSGNMKLLGASGGTWMSPGMGDTAIPFKDRGKSLVFSLARQRGFPRFNPFANLPKGTQGLVMGGPSDMNPWTLTAP